MRRGAIGAVLLAAALFWVVAGAASARAEPAGGDEIRAELIRAAIVPIRYFVDGEPVSPAAGEEGFIVDGATYVPLRFVAYAVEKNVHWDAATSTVTVFEPSEPERRAIRKYIRAGGAPAESDAALTGGAAEIRELEVYRRPVAYVFDGVRIEPEDAKEGLIYRDRLFVPLRFFAESLGKRVHWDGKNYSISISAARPKPSDPADAVPDLSPAPEDLPGDGTPEAPSGEGGELPSAPPVPFPIGGGGGTLTPKPSYEALTAEAEKKLYELQNRCETRLAALADAFFETFDLQYIAEGRALERECDKEFDAVVGDLEAKLKQYGYNTAIIGEYRSAYEKMKEDKEKELRRRLFGD